MAASMDHTVTGMEKSPEIIQCKRPPSTTTVTTQSHHPAPDPNISNTSGDGHSITSLGRLFQFLTTLTLRDFFLISNLNLPRLILIRFPPAVSLQAQQKRPDPTGLQPRVGSHEAPPEPPPLQPAEPQLPGPFLTRHGFQTFHKLCPSLITLHRLTQGPSLSLFSPSARGYTLCLLLQ